MVQVKVILDTSGYGFNITDDGLRYMVNMSMSQLKNGLFNGLTAEDINLDNVRKNFNECYSDFKFRINSVLLETAESNPQFIEHDFSIEVYELPEHYIMSDQVKIEQEEANGFIERLIITPNPIGKKVFNQRNQDWINIIDLPKVYIEEEEY